MNTTEFKKLKSSLRHRLLGMAMIDKRYTIVVEAFEFAARVHTGTRKDGKTPNFAHQLNMLGKALSLHDSLENPIEVYVNILLHDTYEDAKDFLEAVPDLFDILETVFVDHIDHIKRISKVIYQKQPDGSYSEIKKEYSVYFDDMANCAICSVSKPIDRSHNMSTMKGVFDLDKQQRYCKEVNDYFLPMMKKARRKFIEQELVYENLKSALNLQISAITHFVEILQGGENVYEKKRSK